MLTSNGTTSRIRVRVYMSEYNTRSVPGKRSGDARSGPWDGARRNLGFVPGNGFAQTVLERDHRLPSEALLRRFDIGKSHLLHLPIGNGPEAGGQRAFHEPNDHLDRLSRGVHTVSYTHLRAHETVLDLVC